MKIKHCALIPCYNHSDTVKNVATAANQQCPVIVVDDGSTEALPELPEVQRLRLEANQGKGAALRAGFERAAELGYTHVVSLDADGQHFPEDIPKLIEASRSNPEAIIVGVRDFFAAKAPRARRWTNQFSNFWFKVETGYPLADSQCGFRCYPLELARRVRTRSDSYAYELEILVRACWAGAPIVPVHIQCYYGKGKAYRSHFKKGRDMWKLSLLNTRLTWESWLLTPRLRQARALGEFEDMKWTAVLHHIMSELLMEHNDSPRKVASAVGLGLFFGIFPIWGWQMAVCAVAAHRLRLNKVVALAASNISIPAFAPFILFGGLALGHWLFTGKGITLTMGTLTPSTMGAYFWHWLIGSCLLALLAGLGGGLVTWVVCWTLRVLSMRSAAAPVERGPLEK